MSDAAAIVKSKLANQWWRLNNLYWIVDAHGNKVKFKPNLVQQLLYVGIWYFNIILKSRQHGITTFICILFLDTCLFNSHVNAGIIAHNRGDAEKFFGEKVYFAYQNLPEWLKTAREADEDNAKTLAFSNGSKISVGTGRSGTFTMLHVSEFGKVCAQFPMKAREIVTGALNTVHPGAFVFIESTAEGRAGYFYDYVKAAEKAQLSGVSLNRIQYKLHFFAWWQNALCQLSPEEARTIIIPPEKLEYFEELRLKHGITLTPEQKAWYSAKDDPPDDDIFREHPSCITGDTQISSVAGIVRMEDIYPDGVITLAKYNKGVASVFEVITLMGYSLKCTADHPIKTVDCGFIKLQDLTAGDMVELRPMLFGPPQVFTYQINHFTQGSIEITPDFAKFLGFFMGDGSFYAATVSIVCDSKDLDTVAEVKRLMDKFLGSTYSRHNGKSEGKEGWIELRVANNGFIMPFEAMNLIYKNCQGKGSYKRNVHVPQFIKQSPREVVKEFLSGLFEADGFAHRNGTGVKFFTKHHSLAKDVQLLLLQFGITCIIYRKDKIAANNPDYAYVGYELVVGSWGARLFQSEIGFVSRRKSERILAKTKIGNNAKPIEMQDAIVSITPAGEAVVYDITTDTNDFSCGGIVVHNCPDEAFYASTKGAYYRRQMAYLRQHGRISDVPYNPALPVNTAWDIGRDAFAVWFHQFDGQRHNIIDYYQVTGEDLKYMARYLLDKPYVYGTHLLPHDGRNTSIHDKEMTRQSHLEDLGLRNVEIVERAIDISVDIEITRKFLPLCWFDKTNCNRETLVDGEGRRMQVGVNSLEEYTKEWDEDLGSFKSKPLHNWASHGADGYRTLAVGLPLIHSSHAGSDWREKEKKKSKTNNWRR